MLCVGLGEACAIAEKEMDEEAARLTKLRDRMLGKIRSELAETYLNGDEEHRLPGNLNISFAYVEGESLMMGINRAVGIVRLGLYLGLPWSRPMC